MNEHFECPDEKRNTRAHQAFANGVQRAVSKVDFFVENRNKSARALNRVHNFVVNVY